MTQGYSTLDSIIREECLQMEDYNLSNYLRYLSFAKEAIRDWNLDKKEEINVLVDVTSSIATLSFPTDMIQWSRIGTVVGDRLKELIVNNKLILAHSLDSNSQPINNSAYTPNYGFPINASNDTSDGVVYDVLYDGSTVYGFGNGGYLNDGQFRVDKANRRFQFSSDWTNKTIYLEYVSTGLHPTGNTVVDENIRKVVKLYIRWQMLETSKASSMSERERAKQLYYDENYMATKRSIVNLDKIVGIARDAYKTTPKM
jgi:hypothetical protein